jgi:hypothetical protein
MFSITAATSPIIIALSKQRSGRNNGKILPMDNISCTSSSELLSQ